MKFKVSILALSLCVITQTAQTSENKPKNFTQFLLDSWSEVKEKKWCKYLPGDLPYGTGFKREALNKHVTKNGAYGAKWKPNPYKRGRLVLPYFMDFYFSRQDYDTNKLEEIPHITAQITIQGRDHIEQFEKQFDIDSSKKQLKTGEYFDYEGKFKADDKTWCNFMGRKDENGLDARMYSCRMYLTYKEFFDHFEKSKSK